MRFFAWVLVAGGLVSSSGGCGSSSDTSSDSRAGAANGTAGDSGVSGSSVGGSPTGVSGAAGKPGSAGAAGAPLALGDSKTEACIAYAVATCERHAVCRNEPTAGCLAASAGCPDLVFSDGSTRTAAGVKACAEDFKAFSCERLENGELPACVTPGTRKVAEPCVFASQCQSLECKGAAGCGVCANPGGEEESCAGSTGGCALGLYCTDSTQTCQLLPRSTASSKFDGKACIVNADCGSASYCPSATHTCARMPSVGMSCVESLDCDTLAYCGSGSRTCRAFQAEGQPCGSAAAATANPYCQTDVGIVCNFSTSTSGTCVKIPVAGEPCTLDEQGAPVAECAGGAHCDKSLAPAKCVPPKAPGSSCLDRTECAPDQDCDCPGGGEGCTAKICVEWHLGGQSCGGESTICHPGFDCVDGTCEPVDTRRTFALACSGGAP
jgi:hypothetical protein